MIKMQSTCGSFTLCAMKKIGHFLHSKYVDESNYNGLYKIKCVKVEYETDYKLNAETMGILVVFYDHEGKEMGKNGIMYRYIGKVENDYAQWDPVYVPSEKEIPEGYRHYIRAPGNLIETSTEGEELMELISEYLEYGTSTEDALLWLGSKLLQYDNLHKMRVTVGSLDWPEFNVTKDLSRKLIGSSDFSIFIENIT